MVPQLSFYIVCTTIGCHSVTNNVQSTTLSQNRNLMETICFIGKKKVVKV